MVKKLTKKATKILKNMTKTTKVATYGRVITVKNAEGDADTTATILVQNKINYAPKVSVIIPVYNVEKYLRECLDSVCNQTLKEIEIICVDDGSTDSSLEILKEYAKKDNRITVMAQENLHAGVARNAGLAVAKGEYLSFLDSDDFFELNMLEEMYNKGTKNKSDIVVCGWYIKDEIKDTLKISNDGIPNWVKNILEINPDFNFADKRYTNLTNLTNPAPWNKLFNSKIVKDFGIKFQNLTCCNDIGFSFSMMALATKINFVNLCLVYYRKYLSNTSHTKHPSDNIIKAAKYIQNNLKKFDVFEKFGQAFYRGISTNFYWEYCRTNDLEKQQNLYRDFLPNNYFFEFMAKYDLNRRRKICFIGTDNICTTVGGALTVFWERARLFQDFGFDVVCVYENKDNNGTLNNNIRTVNLWGYGDTDLPTNKRFELFLSKEKPDVLIFLMPSVVYRYTNDIDISKCVSVLMLHSRPDVYFEENPNKNNLIKACKKIDYMQVLLPSFLSIAKQYFPDTKMTIIPNYIVPVKQIGNKIENKKLMFFSRCDVGKNIPLLLNAYKIVHDKHPEWTLEIYGESEPESYIEKCKNLVSKLNISNNVLFVPRSENGKEILNTADIFVYPSYFEGFPLGFNEALSAGLPCVVLNGCSAVNEIVQNGVNGFLCDDDAQDFADKIIYLIEHPSERKQMGINAKQTVQCYDKRTIEEMWLDFIVNTINKTFVDENIKQNVSQITNYTIQYIHSKWDDFNVKTDKPIISIIVPVYNVVNYIDNCLQSLLNQTFKNIEIICIDDGSSDGSYTKILGHANSDSRIKVYKNPANRKQGYCRNFGISKSRGKYVFFCDSDDFIASDTIEKLYNTIEQNNGEICCYLLQLFDDKTKQIIDLSNQNFDSIKKIGKKVYSYKDDPNIIFDRVEPVLKLYKKDFLVNNNIKFLEGVYFEDTIVHIKCMSLAKRICYLDEKCYFYRRNVPGQTTSGSKNTEKFLDIFNYINLAESFFKKQGMWKDVKKYYYSFAVARFCNYYNRCEGDVKPKFAKLVKKWFFHKNKRRILKSNLEYKDQIIKILNLVKTSKKPYLLLPYYLACCIYLKYIKLPIFKFIKHTRAIIYSHSHRGKTDLLNKNFRQIMDIVQMFRDETNRRIDLLKNQQNDNNKRVESAVVDAKNQINNQQKLFESKILETNKKIDVIQNNIYEKISESVNFQYDKINDLKDVLNNISSEINQNIDVKRNDLSDLIQRNSNSMVADLTDKILDVSKTNSDIVSKTKKELSDKIIDVYNTNTNIIETKYQELSENVSKAIDRQIDNGQRIESAVVDVKDNIIKTLDANKKELNNSIERDQVLYFNSFETRTRFERGMCDMTSAPDFENRFKKLISGLKQNDVATIVKIIRRLQMIKGTNSKLDLFTKEEKDLLQRVRDFDKEILKVSDNLYAYKNYLLPINHFETSVFLYNHGIEKLNTVENFKDKDILDVGGFIGDSVLMLSPLTNKKIYSFEAIKENFDLMQKTIELNSIKNAVPVHVAVGDKPGEIEIRFNGSASSQNDIMVKNPKYIEKCQVIKMDDYVREHNINVGLIKVDIEGAEQSFLRGAKETICKYKPTLLISIYHNVDDFLDIKPLIESWNLGYKFKIFKPVIESVSGETLLICEQ